MATFANIQPPPTRSAAERSLAEPCAAALELQTELTRWFSGSFAVIDGDTGNVLGHAPPFVALNEWDWWRDLACAAGRAGSPEMIEEDGPVGLLALPLVVMPGCTWVAVGAIAIRRPLTDEPLDAAARLLGQSVPDAARWLEEQEHAPPVATLRMARLFAAKFESDRAGQDLRNEADALALHLSSTYEEISLLYRLTQNLKLTRRKDELGRLALEWLAEVLPARAIVIQLAPRVEAGLMNKPNSVGPLWLTRGPCPLSSVDFSRLIEHLGLTHETQSVVLNPAAQGDANWPQPAIRQLLITPLCEGEHLFGWLAAFNHIDDAEFGTLENNLMSSVAAILGIHSGNIELYRQQRDFLASVVRALTSAIDAKDPYTCGHSDRVANVAVQVGRELAFDKEQLNTLYLSGLLHDIGKIGIDDQVLNKPGTLTPDEFEHIKTHTVIGHRILKDLKQLDQLLPVVLHHHEQWDGGGYPHQLAGEEIPLMARIVAVADAFDAMSSDRPYRPGMSWEKIREIFKAGADKQWDARIVEAFMRTQAKADDVGSESPALPQSSNPPQAGSRETWGGHHG